MKEKRATIILMAMVIIWIMSACSLFELRPAEIYDTPEELVQSALETIEGYEEGDPYVYREIEGYVFILCGEVLHMTGKYYKEEEGYGSLLIPKAINTIVPIESTGYIGIDMISCWMETNGDYLIKISGRRFVDGKSVEDPNFPLKIYDNEGNELEKLYDYEQTSCIWISVLHEIPEDYAVYVDYKGETYLLYDAQTILEKTERSGAGQEE